MYFGCLATKYHKNSSGKDSLSVFMILFDLFPLVFIMCCYLGEAITTETLTNMEYFSGYVHQNRMITNDADLKTNRNQYWPQM